MTRKVNVGDINDLLKSVKEFALTVNEECPEGHRRDPGSGACLPIGPTDHTAFTRSVNDDQGDLWRGLKDKPNETFDDDTVSDSASVSKESALLDGFDMEEFTSCSQGTTFSFVQKKCVSLLEAEQEDAGELVFVEEAQNGHEEVVSKDPAGRRDTVGFECPPNQLFDFKRRECIPLNKDTVMASLEGLGEEEKAMYLSGKLALTSPDPLDGHYHLVTVDVEGNGKTSVARMYGAKDDPEYHSHDVKGYMVSDYTEGDYTSRHFGHVIPREMYEYEDMHSHMSHRDQTSAEVEDDSEAAKELKTKQRKSLPDSAFGVPGKRKFPLHDCSHVRNAMARFNQAKGLTPGEKSTLRRKILARAKSCNIDVKNFAKAYTQEDFSELFKEMLSTEERVRETYAADHMKNNQGPCPPGMVWDMKMKKCMKAKGFVDEILKASHTDIIAKDPVGRRDTVNFQCPSGWIFDFANRKCIPLDPSNKQGFNPGATASDDSAAQRDLAPSPKGRPARLPQDCPKGTIWDADLEKCKPLDSRKKTKSADEDAQKAANGPGKDKDSKGCDPGEFFNPIMKKCMPLPGKKKAKSGKDNAVNANPGNREGLTEEVPGKVKLPSDCPAGTIWDGARRTCTPLSTMDKNRPSGKSPENPKDLASKVDSMTKAQLVHYLDVIIKESGFNPNNNTQVFAKDLPNEAFPPSLVRSSKRSLLHHTPDVTDPYDNATVNVSRLRNALARVDKLQDYSVHALEEASSHLMYHAREVVKTHLGKS